MKREVKQLIEEAIAGMMIKESDDKEYQGNVRSWGEWLKLKADGYTSVKGNFDCTRNKLTSLKGSPRKVGGDFVCMENPLISLEGCPDEVGGVYNISGCKGIKSLKGLPNTIHGLHNWGGSLISLKDSPQIVTGNFTIANNVSLTSLEGGPQKIGGLLDVSSCNLKSLIGGPKDVGGDYKCYDNPNLKSYEGRPLKLGGLFVDTYVYEKPEEELDSWDEIENEGWEWVYSFADGSDNEDLKLQKGMARKLIKLCKQDPKLDDIQRGVYKGIKIVVYNQPSSRMGADVVIGVMPNDVDRFVQLINKEPRTKDDY